MGTNSTLLSLWLGQIMSLCVTFTGFTCSQLAKKGVYAPFSMCLLLYLLLALVYGGIMICRGQPLKVKSYIHSAMALFDVLAKLYVIKAYRYISLTSVTLLDLWTLPCIMVILWLFFNKKYVFQELIGFAICVAGLVVVVLSDVHSADGSSNPLRGDLLIIVGATIYAVDYSFQAFFNESYCVEILTFSSIYGAIYCAPQIVIYERNEFKFILSSPGTMFLLIGFSLATILLYAGLLLLIEINEPISGMRMQSMSLLTSNMWAVLIQIFVYHEKVNWIYFVCFAAVTLGYILIFYSGKYEIDPNNDEPATIDEKAFLSYSNNDGID